ncbi:MAG: hypothetical protein WBH00_13115 [Xanthobacteraceae bacterium]
MLHLYSETHSSGLQMRPAPVSTTIDRIKHHKALGRTLFSRDDNDVAEMVRIRRERERVLRSFKSDPPRTPSEAGTLIRYILTLCYGFELTRAERDCLKAVAKSLAGIPSTEAE